MRKVVDASGLRSEELTDFLSASNRNFAVISDYAQMESLKGVGIVNLKNSLRVLSRFPKQVLVLKSTPKIAGLIPRSSGLQKRLIDEFQTAGFAKYCSKLFSSTTNPFDLAYDTTRKELKAKSHFSTISDKIEDVRRGMTMLFDSYPPEDLRRLRANEIISDNFADRVVMDILLFSARLLRENHGNKNYKENTIYSLQFRFALCCYVLALKRASDGGVKTVPHKNLQNDFTDMTYAAYATFFDGLITSDKKLEQIYRQSVWLLNNVLC